MLDLGLDHLAQRDFVLVFEFLRVELGRLAFDKLLGERELIFLNGDRLDVGEVAGGVTQLFGITQT